MYSGAPNDQGVVVIGEMENFWKTNKRRGWNKRGGEHGWDGKWKAQMAQANIPNEHFCLYAAHILKLFPALLYVVIIWLRAAVS